MSYASTYREGLQTEREPAVSSVERHGVVYTKPWVVETILDLAGYVPDDNLVDARAVEPAAGEGAFILRMVHRLIESCHRQGRPLRDCATSLLTYELDEASSEALRSSVARELSKLKVSPQDVEVLLDGWLRTGDYLLDAQNLPPVDFVVGNPPYIRLEEMEESAAILYRMLYPTMVGRADLYIAFFEAALKQLKPSGVCAFICADRWMLNQYGAELRRFVTSGYNVETLIEMHQADAFETDVSAYPAITIIRRGKQGRVVVASAGSEVEKINPAVIAKSVASLRDVQANGSALPGLTTTVIQTWFKGSEPWPRIPPTHLSILKKLETDFYPLETYATRTKVSIGVATGADDIFITTDPNLVEPTRLLPLSMAYDTVEGRLRWSGHYLVNPWNDEGLVDLDKYPRLKAYFEQHQDRLKKRHIGKKNPVGWYRTIDRVNHDLVPKPKLYIPDIKDELNPVLDVGETYPHHNLYFIQSEDWDHEVLGGLLLSAIGQFFIECYGVRMRGGYLRFQAQYLRRIRVPRPQDIRTDQAKELIKAFRSRDRALATQAALDVYQLASLHE